MADDLDFDELFDDDAREFDPLSSPLGSHDDTDFDDDFEDQFRANGDSTAVLDLSSDPFADRDDRFDGDLGTLTGTAKPRRPLWKRGRPNRFRRDHQTDGDFPDILGDHTSDGPVPADTTADDGQTVPSADLNGAGRPRGWDSTSFDNDDLDESDLEDFEDDLDDDFEDDLEDDLDGYADELSEAAPQQPVAGPEPVRPADIPAPPSAPPAAARTKPSDSDSFFDMLDEVEELSDAELAAVLAGLEDDQDDEPESHDRWWIEAETPAGPAARTAPMHDSSADVSATDPSPTKEAMTPPNPAPSPTDHSEPADPDTGRPDPGRTDTSRLETAADGQTTDATAATETTDEGDFADGRDDVADQAFTEAAAQTVSSQAQPTPQTQDVAAVSDAVAHSGTADANGPTTATAPASKRFETRASRDRFPLNAELSDAVSDLVERAWSTGLGRFVFIASDNHVQRRALIEAIGSKYRGRDDLPTVTGTVTNGVFVGEGSPSSEAHTLMRQLSSLIDEGLEPFKSLLTSLIDLNASSQALARSLITAGQPLDVLSLVRVLTLAAAGEGPVVVAIDRADRAFGNWWHILSPTLAADALERHPILVFVGIDGAQSANASQAGFPPDAEVASKLVLGGKAEWWAVASLSDEDIRRWTGPISRDVLDRLAVAGGRESRATATVWESWISQELLTTAKADGRWVVSHSTAPSSLNHPEPLPPVELQVAQAAAITGSPWRPEVIAQAFGVTTEVAATLGSDGSALTEAMTSSDGDSDLDGVEVQIASDSLAAALRSSASEDTTRELLSTLLKAWKSDSSAVAVPDAHDRARLARQMAEPQTASDIEAEARVAAERAVAPVETEFYLAQVGQQTDGDRHELASLSLLRACLETDVTDGQARALDLARGGGWHAAAAQRVDLEARSLGIISRLLVRSYDSDPADELLQQSAQDASRALEMALSVDATAEAGIANLAIGEIARREDRLDDAELALRTALDLLPSAAGEVLGSSIEQATKRDITEATFELAMVRAAQGAQADAAAFATEALGDADNLTDAQRAPLHHLLGLVALQGGDLVAARTNLEQALTLREQTGDESGGSDTLRLLGIVASRSGERDQADAYFADAARVARRVARGSDLEALAIAERGEHLVRFGDTEEGIGALEAAHRMALRLDDEPLQTRVGSQIVDALMTRAAKRRNSDGDQAAIDSSRKALEYARSVQDPQRTMLALIELADTRLALDQLDAVEPLIAESLELTETRGDSERLDHARSMAASLARRRSDIALRSQTKADSLDTAITQLGAALEFERLRNDNAAIATDGYRLAILYRQADQIDAAEALLRESLSLWTTAGETANASNAMQRLAEISLAKGDLDDAEHMLNDAFEIRRESDDQLPKLETLSSLAQVHEERYNRSLDAGDLNEAIANLERLADVSGEIRDEDRMAQSLHELGSLHMRQGDDVAAQIAFDRAEALRVSLGDEVGLRATRLAQIDLRQKRASRLALSHELSDAAQATAEGIEIAKILGDKTHEANMHAAAGAIAKQAGDEDKALVEYRQAAALFREENRPGPSAQSLLEVGLIELANDDLDNAEPHLNEANELAKSAGGHATMATARHALGVACVSRGDRDGAQQHFEAALELRRSLGDQPLVVQTLAALRVVLFEKGESALRGGRLEVAGKDLERSLEMARELGDQESTADALHSLGVLSLRRGKPADAQSYLTEALTISKALGRMADMAATYHALGDLYLRAGQLTDAERNLEEALRIRRELDDPERTADTLHTLGVLHLNRDAEDTSEGYFAEALALRESIGDTRDAATTLHALGALHVRSARARMTTDRLGARLRLELAEQRLKAASDMRREINDIRGAEQSEGLMAEARTLFDDAQPALPR